MAVENYAPFIVLRWKQLERDDDIQVRVTFRSSYTNDGLPR